MGAVEQNINLRAYSYHGITLPDEDTKNQGRYKVHIPELHHLISQGAGIWVKNQQHHWRWTPSNDYMYGNYYPLQPGTKVLVKFYDNDFHTGYIERIISDQVMKTNPKVGCGVNPEATTDRDDIYMIYKTPKKHNLFLICEQTKDTKNGLTKDLIPNSIHLYYNYHRTTMILNEDGIHWFTMDNRGVTVEGNNSEWVNKNEKIYVRQNRDLYVVGNHTHYTQSNYNSLIDGYHHERSEGKHSTQSGFKITEDAPTIWMNSGHSTSPLHADVNKGEDEIKKQNKIDMRIIAHQNKDDTYYGCKFTDQNGVVHELVGGVPPAPKEKGDKKEVKIPSGLNDRTGQIGLDQCDGNYRAYPTYPVKVSSSGVGSIGVGTGIDNIVAAHTGGIGSAVTNTITGGVGKVSNVVGGSVLSTAAVITVLGTISNGLNALNTVNNTVNVLSTGSILDNLIDIPTALGNVIQLGGISSVMGQLGNLTSIHNTRSINSVYGLYGGGSFGNIGNIMRSVNGYTGPLEGIGNLGNVLGGLDNAGMIDSLTSVVAAVTGSVDVGNIMNNTINITRYGGLPSNVSLGTITSTVAGFNVDSIINSASDDTILETVITAASSKLGVGSIVDGLTTGMGINSLVDSSNTTDKVLKQLTNLVGLVAISSGTPLGTLANSISINNMTNNALSTIGIDQITGNVNDLTNMYNTSKITNTLSDSLGISNSNSQLIQLSQGLSNTDLVVSPISGVAVTVTADDVLSKNGISDLGKLEATGALNKLSSLSSNQLDNLIKLAKQNN